MHSAVLPAVLLLLLVNAVPALAGAGLPKLASLQIGDQKVVVYNDSPAARIGANTLTVEAARLPGDHTLELRLYGPRGETQPVALQPLRILQGPAAVHSGAGDSHDEAAANDHGAPGSAGGTHSSPAQSHPDAGRADSHGEDTRDFAGRARVVFPTGGTWRAILSIRDETGEQRSAEASFDVTYGGPSPIYLGATGSLIAGSMLYGSLLRRRHSGRR